MKNLPATCLLPCEEDKTLLEYTHMHIHTHTRLTDKLTAKFKD